MKKVIVSAPGKLHLTGEHAVVHGNPAVLVSTSNRLYVTLEESPAAESGMLLQTMCRDNEFIGEICKVFESRFSKKIPSSLSVTIASDIPVGAGMGSSAALSVAFIGAMSVFMDVPWEPQSINEAAYQAEKFMHVNSSGSDPAIVTHGGILWYRKELDYLKTFWLLPFKIPKSFAPFVLINTGRQESTGDLVAAVGERKKKNKKIFQVLLDDIEAVTKCMAVAIHDENEQDFRMSIQENQRLLEKIGVVSGSTKTFIRAIEKAGGVAKISGAGGVKRGSGVIIAMNDNTKILKSIADKYKFPAFQVEFGGEGIRKEQVIA